MKTILIVDDDEDTRILCERALRFKGYETCSVGSGEEALQFVERNPEVKLVILDIKMAPLDGVQVLEKLRAKRMDVPVILYSDYPAYKGNFKTWLADTFLVKSSDLTELRQKACEFLSPKKR
jgi:DNA-binding NtrC family response regulator